MTQTADQRVQGQVRTSTRGSVAHGRHLAAPLTQTAPGGLPGNAEFVPAPRSPISYSPCDPSITPLPRGAGVNSQVSSCASVADFLM